MAEVVQTEAQLLADIRLALGKDRRVTCWRNNTGVLPAATRTGTRPLAYGLCVGSSDLIGVVKVDAKCMVSAPELQAINDNISLTIGIDPKLAVRAMREARRVVGRFLALEVKTPIGKPTDAQLRFLALINSMGGYGVIVRSVREAQDAVDAAASGDSAGAL